MPLKPSAATREARAGNSDPQPVSAGGTGEGATCLLRTDMSRCQEGSGVHEDCAEPQCCLGCLLFPGSVCSLDFLLGLCEGAREDVGGRGIIAGVGWRRVAFVKVVVLCQHHAELALPLSFS